jgi:hypothetical protein
MPTAALATLVAVLLLGGARTAAADVRFDDWFRADATLRVDYVHSGSFGAEEVNLERLVREGAWPGSRTKLLDPTDAGKHRVLVLGAGPEGAQVELYSRGFGSLFSEWQTTPEARGGLRRAFSESVRIPYPKAPVLLVVETRDGSGAFRTVQRIPVDPADTQIEPPRYAPGSFPVVRLLEVGAPEASLDVLILGDGYTKDELEKYHRDLERFARAFFETPPFRIRQDRINLRALDVVSAQSGPDEPRKGVWRDTALGTTFNTFGAARYLTTLDNRALRDVAGTAPYDVVFILVNTSRYGGAGVFNQFSIFPSDNEYDEYVMIHEFGHGFAGLADEYYQSGVSYEEFYPAGVEPWEPNITALLPDGEPKWADLLTPEVPCPTPPDPALYGNAVGCFEGAGYQAKGLYRPTIDCLMFSKGDQPFCPVCAAAIVRMIDLYAVP